MPRSSYDLEIMPEDDLTAEIINSMTLIHRNIARHKWSSAMTLKMIAEREGLTVKKVRTRIHWIKEQVAQGALM